MSIQSAEAPSIENIVAEIDKFLSPVMRERDSNKSIAEKLADVTDGADVSLKAKRGVLQEASRLLESLDEAVAFDQKSDGPKQAYDSRLLGAVYNLLDVLVLEGIFPSLPAGVGNVVERRTKSLLYRKPDPSYVSPPCGEGLLDMALVALDEITATPDSGIENILRHRILADMIAGTAWFSHSKGSPTFSPKFNQYLSRLPIPTLYLALTSLNKPNAPAWFRAMITGHLSLLPLRPNGVRHTIEFIASSYPARKAPAGQDDAKPSKGPALPLEGLQQASRLLSSIPQSMTPEEYLTRLAPQLLNLLDQAEEKELSRAAAFIIGSGILGKRALGAPGTIGWRLFVEPSYHVLNPLVTPASQERKKEVNSNVLKKELVSTASLIRALRRLSVLTSSHPNPGLTGRLIKPVLLPLWGLMTSNETPTMAISECAEMAFSLLQAFFKLSGGLNEVNHLSKNLLFDGPPEWIYGQGREGGMSIRERDKQQHANLNIIELVPRIDSRVRHFIRLLSSGSVDQQVTNSFFLNLSEEWLLPQSKQGTNQLQIDVDPLETLTKAKLAQAILENFQDKISQQPDQILNLIEQILHQQSSSLNAERRRKNALKAATYSSLSKLVGPQESDNGTPDDPQEMLAVAVSLLNAILTSTTFTSSKATSVVLESIRSILSSLATMPDSPLSASLKMSIQSSLSLLSNTRQQDSGSNVSAPQTDVHEALNLIVTDLSSSLPPIRTSALFALEALIKIPSEPLDVPTIALLLLNNIKTEVEEYVYLAAIKGLVQLALRRNMVFVTKMVREAFMDIKEETGVDGRLRLGQTLSSVVEALSVNEDAVNVVEAMSVLAGVAEVCITVSSRRGSRQKEEQERKAALRLEKRRKREAERAWGGEVPKLPTDDEDSEEENLGPEKKRRRQEEREAISKIVQGWAETGLEEDIRIRTSALSILLTIFSSLKTMSLLPNNFINDTTQTCLAILTLENASTSAILRRAAVMVLLLLLRSVDSALEQGKEMMMDLEKWNEIEKVLHFVLDTDTDDLVVSHAKDFLDSLEAWNMKRIQVVTHGQEGEQIRFGLEGKLRGLDVNPHVEESKGRKMIEEIE